MMGEAALLSVDEALSRILHAATALGEETIALDRARGRFLASDLVARRTQPPSDMSAMDGYALRAADLATADARVRLIGESAAGHPYASGLAEGETIRIFTGAPTPEGADAILLQEDAIVEGDRIGARVPPACGRHIRTRGLDFRAGEAALRAGERLGPAQIALAASLGYATVAVARRPRVALLASGDELVPPGVEPGPAQIVACNGYAAAALIEEAGGVPVDLGIFQDKLDDLERGFAMAREVEPDVLVTLGGASVGDHDLLRPALARQGMSLDFWRVAMRPGKPLIFGRLGETRVLGLPGNPVASFVAARIFLTPLLRALQGDAQAASQPLESALAGADMKANKGRRDYMRAALTHRNGALVATPQPLQDSSLMTELARSQALIVREIGAGPVKEGEPCSILRF